MASAHLDALVSCVELDARRLADDDALPAGIPRSFASVLVDAPCSGTGTMRRHPEIPWSLDAAALDPAVPGSLPSLQLELLRAASARVVAGGSLRYATCSVLRAENEGVIEAFLASPEGGAFERAGFLDGTGAESLPARACELARESLTADGWLRSTPGAVPFDGHFCAHLVRRA